MTDSISPDGHAADDGAARAPALARGTRLDDGLEIERVLAESGFAVVYLATDRALDRVVAVKEYFPRSLALRDAAGAVAPQAPAHAEAFARGRAAFVEESRQLARIDHPSLVRVLRAGEDRGTAWRMMPCYPGRSLRAVREAMAGPPDEASLRALADGLLGALDALHREGLLHGAVAPEHIMLLPDDRPVLLDFRAVERALVGERGQGLMQSLEPSFAPLERLAPSPERPPGPWSDLYSLAALLRWCIAGEPPAAATRAGAAVPMAEALRRVQERAPQVRYSAVLLEAIDAALAPRPADRPQSVAELRALLDGRLDRAGLGERARARRAASSAAAVADGAARDAPPSEESPDGRSEPRLIDEPGDDHVLAALERALAAVGIGTPAPAPARAAARAESRSEPAARAEPFAAARADPFAAARAEPVAAPRPEASAASPHAPAPPPRLPPPAARGQRRVVWGSAIALLAALGAIGWELSRQWTPDELRDGVAVASAQLQRAAGAALDGLREQGSELFVAVQQRLGTTDRSTSIDLPAAPTAAGVAAAPLAASSPALDAATASLHAADAALAAARASPPAPAASAVAAAAVAPAAAASSEPHEAVPAAAPAVAAEEPAPRPRAKARERTTHPAARAPRALASERPVPRAVAPERRLATRESAEPRRSPPAPAPVDAPAAPPREAVVAKGPASPREVCGDRTQFALYYCMQTQCEQPQWARHPQCIRLRDRDEVTQ